MYQLLSDMQYRGKYASRQEIHIQKLESSDDVALYMNSNLMLSVTVYDIILDYDRNYLVIHAKNDDAVNAALSNLKAAKREERVKSAAAYQAFLQSRR